ncbi:MAG: phenylpropionate dioxygenase-like ring-hydroxylating dioxygenase large terminal subunit [Kiritimatiellia bacterium]|jgi:phenylpropionate dioxygenase-like ring-hydroxylating dioxygenase large terminal subunit
MQQTTQNPSATPGTLPGQPKMLKAWFVAAWSHEVTRTPTVRQIYDVPLVLWRDSNGKVACFLDRCPHRAVPLSMGKVVDDTLQCGYHGWRFDIAGNCNHVPGLIDQDKGARGRCATSYSVMEQQGLVWIYMSPADTPDKPPFTFPWADKPGYTTVRQALQTRGSVYQAIENALDVPHTKFLHGGLFRQSTVNNKVHVVIQRWHDRCEAEFIGEPMPTGFVARLISPSGGTVSHFDRFYLPCITEVEYRLGPENHLILTGAWTPVSDWETRLYAVVSLRTRVPGWLARAVIKPAALRVFAQDAKLLNVQVNSIETFGAENYLNTEIDLLGPHILNLMKRVAKDQLADPSTQPFRKELDMVI